MSYFNIDANTMNEDLIQTHDKQVRKAPHSVPHTPQARKRISETQKARYRLLEALIKKAKQKQITEDNIKEICRKVIDEYLNRNAQPLNNDKEPINNSL